MTFPVKMLGRGLKKILSYLLLLIVVVFFVFYLWSRIREKNNEAPPSTGKYVQAGDIQIFVEDKGVGEPVLLVHGTGAWNELWESTANFLVNHHFRVISVDVPPFGYSEKPLGPVSYSRVQQAKRLLALLDSLNISQIHLVGHSVGARPVVEAVLMQPNRIKSLVLVDPALGFLSEAEPVFVQNKPDILTRAIFTLKYIRDSFWATVGTNPWLTKTIFQSLVYNKEAITHEKVSLIQKTLTVSGMNRAQADWLEFLVMYQDYSLSSNFDHLKEIKAPSLIIWGDKDSVTPLWQGKKLDEWIPNSELKIMKDVGHIPYVENPELFNSLLIEFWLSRFPQ